MTLPPYARDIGLAAGLAALGELELFSGERYNGKPVWPGPMWLDALAILALTAPLVVRRQYPEGAVIAIFSALSVYSLTLGATEAAAGFILLIVTAFSGGAYAKRLWIVLVAASVFCTVFVFTDASAKGIVDQTWVFGLGAAAILLGRAVHARQRRIGTLQDHVEVAEVRHAAEVAEAVAAERGVIARELHDIVSHAVSVIVIQAQAGGRALPLAPGVAAGALTAIEDSARTAMVELRRLLTVLGPDLDATAARPVASLAQLDDLLARWRAAGLRIDIACDALPTLPPAVDLTAFRIVQEALTNTASHAPGAASRVALTLRGDQLEVIVHDTGNRSPAVESGMGRGLIGMRQRVELVGGELVAAGPCLDGFLVHARLPVTIAPPS